MDNKKSNKKTAVILISILTACVLITVVIILILNGRSKEPAGGGAESSDSTGNLPESSSMSGEETEDAETFYRKNGEVISITKVESSGNVPDESEAKTLLTERGFDQFDITTDYSIGGEFLDEQTIGDTGNRHPIYETYYRSESDMLWTIDVVDGALFAYPASYNLDSGANVLAIVSEKDSIIGYDSETNQFFEYVPKDTTAVVIKTNKIDAEHLNRLTTKEIDKYVK